MSAPGPHAASAKCGKSCLAAHLQEGPSTGTWISATYPVSGEMDTYVAVPPGTSLESVKKDGFDKIILWCADVYGPRFINNQLLIDWMASQGGCAVVLAVPPLRADLARRRQATSSSAPTTSTRTSSPPSAASLGSTSASGSSSSASRSRGPAGRRSSARSCSCASGCPR